MMVVLKSTLNIWVCVIGLFSFHAKIYAQHKEISFKHLSTVDGLSNFTVLSITQDRQGFMWFGTMDGLNRFDGKQIKTYREDPDNPNSLGNNYIYALQISSDSGMWIGTNRGLYYYNLNFDNFRFIPLPVSSGGQNPMATIHAMALYEGELWIGANQRLLRYDLTKDKFIPFDEKTRLYSFQIGTVNTLKATKNGEVWIGHTQGLLHYFDGTFQKIDIDTESNQLTNVISLEMDAKDRLWVGTANLQTALTILDFKANERLHLSQQAGHTPHNRVNCIKRFQDGKIWVGTTLGMAILDEELLTSRHLFYDNSNPGSLSQNSIKQIFQSTDSIVWIGTYSGGINFFDPYGSNITHVTDKYRGNVTLNVNIVSSIFEDRNKNLWIGTEYGGINLYKKKEGTIEVLREGNKEQSLISDNIKSIIEDDFGRIFIATQFGLSIYDQRNKDFYNISNQKITERGRISFPIVHDLARDNDGNIWIGTTGGAAHFQMYDVLQDTIYHFIPTDKSFPTLNSTVVNSSIFDHIRNIVWYGGNNGLAGFDIVSKKYLTDSAFLPAAEILQNTVINDIYLDMNGLIWIATFGRGLFILDPDSYELRSLKNDEGITEKSFYAITEDNNGNIWTSLNAYLLKIEAPKSIKDPIAVVERFGPQEGFPPQQYFRTAACKGADGRLYFGGDDGFISFDPDEIENRIIYPSVAIMDILVNGKSLKVKSRLENQFLNVAILKNVTLDHDQSSFTVQFMAPNYNNPDNTWYQYQLSGTYNDWQELGNSNTINFTKLKAGDYELKLRASSDPNNFKEAFTSIKLSILPPYWSTPLAYTIYVILVLVLLYAFFIISRNWERLSQNLRFEHLEREKENEFHQQRIKFFTDVSHELRTPLTLILAPLERLVKSNFGNANIKNQLMLMLRNGDRMLQLINQLLDLRKLETGHMQLRVAKGDISKFVMEVSLSFKELARNRDIEFNVVSDKRKINIWFDRDKFEIILFNLFSNALKFTPESGKISILIEEVDSDIKERNKQGKLVRIKVSNTGRGIPEDQIAHIFERFYTGDVESTYDKYSSGVGLEIVKELVSLHHGSICVESSYDEKGENGMTTFVLSLPMGKRHYTNSELINKFRNSEDISSYKFSVGAAPSELDEAKLLEENRKGHYEQSVLIVEDNAEVRSLIVDIFCREFDVLVAGDGKQGLYLAIEHIPDLIISDVMMPEMDGIELCRRLKRDVVTSHIPVILLTARTAVTFKYEGLETGADDYIVKPFNIENLKVRAKNLIHQRQLLKEKFTRDGSFLPSDITMTSVDEKFMQRVRDYIIENIGTDRLTVEKIAEETGMSRANFYRKIKVLTNMSAAEFLKKIKMDYAAQLLKTNKFRVSEVQSIIGISDGAYFRKSFKLQFGITPKDYIDKYQE